MIFCDPNSHVVSSPLGSGPAKNSINLVLPRLIDRLSLKFKEKYQIYDQSHISFGKFSTAYCCIEFQTEITSLLDSFSLGGSSGGGTSARAMSGVQSLDEQQSANETIQADKTNINIIKQDIDDVQKIMLGTMDDIFRKGEGLAKLEEKAEQMASISNRYHQRSKELNRKRQYGCLALLILLALILFFLYKKFSN